MKIFYKKEMFDESRMKYDAISDEDFAVISRYLPDTSSSPTILDLGCGSCAVSERFKEMLPGSSIVGIDISLQILKWTDEPCCQGDATFLPFENESFDLVLGAAAFHHFPYIDKVLSESYRCLKDGGILFAYDPNKYHLQRFIMMTDPLRHIFYKNGDHAISPFSFKRKLASAGFKNTNYIYISFGYEIACIPARINNFIQRKISSSRFKFLSIFISPWFIITGVKKHGKR